MDPPFAKATHIFFFQQKTCEFGIVLTRTVNIFTTNKLIKLRCFEQVNPVILSDCTCVEFCLDHHLSNETVLKALIEKF